MTLRSRKIYQGVADRRQMFRLFDQRIGHAGESFVPEYRGKRTVLVDGLGHAEIKLSEDLTDDESSGVSSGTTLMVCWLRLS